MIWDAIGILVVVLTIAGFFGFLNLRRASFGFLLWLLIWASACAGAVYFATTTMGDTSWGFLAFYFCLASAAVIPVGGLLFALLTGLRSKPSPNPLSKQACEAYYSLHPEQQYHVRRGVRMVASAGAALLADRLEKRGASNAARTFSRISEDLG